ncbi:hypothetical protein MVEN_00621900 [Mycena venus]|uniref:Uncharacterized protein n=1 Tax=Mycena venus TaxID=2733690 RepID=A0A8H7D8J6_9AGAR|nr:hypothetical protein MVEN_00621900 [Mycena venus]
MAYRSNTTRYAASQSHYSTFNSPTRRRLPLEVYNPPKWRASMAGGTGLHSPVFFDYLGQAGQGVSMRDLRLKGVSTPIQCPNDLVLAHTRLQRIIFRIIWPGYEHVEWCRTITVTSSNGAAITRAALGVQIASSFAHFVEKSQYETPTSRDWMVAPSCVRFEHLYLISLHNTFEDVWQAEVALDLC